MSDLNHQPCPHESCGSSDAFSWSLEKHVGFCYSCGQAYPSKGMHVMDWAAERYPLKNDNINSDYEERTVSKANLKIVDDSNGYFHPLRGVLKGTMEFYNVKTFNQNDEPHNHVYVYPNGSTKTRVFPKDFHTGNGFKSDMLFGMDKFPAGSARAVTITEGELDALSAYQMLGSQYPVVSLPGATPSKKLLENCKDWLGSFEKIYLSFDSDRKAEKFALSLMHLFPGRVYEVPHDKYKDANAFLQDGKSQLFKNAWFNAKLFTPDNIYSSEDAFLKLLHDTPEHSYIPTNIQALDEKLLGLMRGHFTVIKGPTGIGKSELMRYLENNFIQNYPQVKFATWHLEETKLRSLLGVVSYYLKDNLTRKDLITEKGKIGQVEEAIKEISANTGYMQFHLREEDGAEELVDQIRVLSQVYGCEYIMFEPIQDVITISNDDSKEAALADLAVRLSKLAADLNVGIITIAHTNEMGEIKYCRMIGQRASVVIDIERDKESDNVLDRNTTKLLIKKNRPTGLEGEAGELLFDPESFTLKEKTDTW